MDFYFGVNYKDKKKELSFKLNKIVDPNTSNIEIQDTYNEMLKKFSTYKVNKLDMDLDFTNQTYFESVPDLLKKIEMKANKNLSDKEQLEIEKLVNNKSFLDLVQKWLEYEQTSTERHLSGYSYCGPGTKIVTHLINNKQPINELDAACRVHDIEYMIFSGDDPKVRQSDMGLLEKLKKMDNSSFFSKFFVKIAFKIKNALFEHSVWEKILYSGKHGLTHAQIQAIGKWAAKKFLELDYN